MANPQYVTLVASTVSTLTLDDVGAEIEVYVVAQSAASDPVYFTIDGTSTALTTLGSNGSFVCGGTTGSAITVKDTSSPGGVGPTVKLKSAGTPTVQVRAV